jgi:hypothetical protein
MLGFEKGKLFIVVDETMITKQWNDSHDDLVVD